MIGDGILSFDLLRCIILVASDHSFKSDEVELPHYFAVVAPCTVFLLCTLWSMQLLLLLVRLCVVFLVLPLSMETV